MPKKDSIKALKIAGILSLVPLILAAGVFVGYAAGNILVKRIGMPHFISELCVGVGIVISIMEVFKIIKYVVKIDKET